MSSKEIKELIKRKKKELDTLEDVLFDVEEREHNEKYEVVKFKGCKGCPLEHCDWNNTCDHCDGYYYKDKLKK